MKLEALEIKSDNRGSLIEAFKLPNDGQLFYVVGLPNQTRGNHYHKRKTERFLIAWGTATISVKDRVKGTQMSVELSGDNPMIVTVAPNNTHNITNDEGYICMIWVDEVFNPKDPDTIMEEI